MTSSVTVNRKQEVPAEVMLPYNRLPAACCLMDFVAWRAVSVIGETLLVPHLLESELLCIWLICFAGAGKL